jgi:hypothetical protein
MIMIALAEEEDEEVEDVVLEYEGGGIREENMSDACIADQITSFLSLPNLQRKSQTAFFL